MRLAWIRLCINCTVVELKQKSTRRIEYFGTVLIVPLWNWNVISGSSGYLLHTVLIVPLWNWNEARKFFRDMSLRINCTVVELKPNRSQAGLTTKGCINCTVVELKHDRIKKENVDGNVLIVPLWNWNSLIGDFSCVSLASINCTVVELKRLFCTRRYVRFSVLIVPLWNWNIKTNPYFHNFVMY